MPDAGYNSDRIPAMFISNDGDALAAFGGFLPVSRRDRVCTSFSVRTALHFLSVFPKMSTLGCFSFHRP